MDDFKETTDNEKTEPTPRYEIKPDGDGPLKTNETLSSEDGKSPVCVQYLTGVENRTKEDRVFRIDKYGITLKIKGYTSVAFDSAIAVPYTPESEDKADYLRVDVDGNPFWLWSVEYCQLWIEGQKEKGPSRSSHNGHSGLGWIAVILEDFDANGASRPWIVGEVDIAGGSTDDGEPKNVTEKKY